MTEISDLVRRLAEKGISLAVAGSNLRVTGRSGLIDDAVKAEIAARKKELIVYLSQPEQPAPIPLSSSQRRLWFLDKLSLVGHEYTLLAAWRLTSGTRSEHDELQGAVEKLVQRHPILAHTVEEVSGEPVFIPLRQGFPGMERISAPELVDEAAILEAEAAVPFKLVGGPLFRVRLITSGDSHPLLTLAIHHIIADHASMVVLVHELSVMLSGRGGELPPSASALDLKTPDNPVTAEEDGSLAYWRSNLEGAPPDIALPFDRKRPSRRSSKGASLRFSLPASADLRPLASRGWLTPFMAYMAAFARVLSQVSGQTDLVIGTPVSRRDRPELRNVVGFLVNTIALRVDLSLQDGATLLQQVRRTVIDALEHQHTPFEKVVAALRPQRHLDRNPLFQALFVLQNDALPALEWPQAGPVARPVPPMAPEVDLSLLMFHESDAGKPPTAVLEYDPSLFDLNTVEHLSALFIATCEGLANDRAAAFDQLPLSRICGPQEQLPDANLGELLRASLAYSPDRVVVHSHHGPSLRAGELLAAATALLNDGLRWPGCERRAVRIAAEAGAPLVTAVVACLLASRPFLIVPRSLEDAGRVGRCKALGIGETIWADEETGQLRLEATTVEPAPMLAPGLAYICLTSGSTGLPKAVHVPEPALRNHAVSVTKRFQLSSQDSVLAFSSPVFDVALEEFIPSLLSGACIVFSEPAIAADFSAFTAMLHERSVTVVNLPAPFWHAWTDWLLAERRPLPGTLRMLITGSDRVRAGTWAAWRSRFPQVALLAGYGPTETTISVTFLSADVPVPDVLTSVPLGRPINNVDVTVRDGKGEVLPLNCVGEIVIEGAAVAHGYGEDQPSGGFIRFLPQNPLAYRSGDRGRLRLDGNLEFLGRMDSQVKIRGVRVDPGAVEAALESHPEVNAAVVLALEAFPGSLALTAFYEGAVAASDLMQWAKNNIGKAATPSRLIRMDALPRLVSGKVDRLAVAQLPVLPDSLPASELPRNIREQLLARAFAAVLDVEQVDRSSNFFDLGGDSLASLRLVAEAARQNLRLTTEMIFRHQTVAAIAEEATILQLVQEADEAETRIPLTPILAFFHRTTGPDWRHFNQAMMIKLPTGVEAEQLRGALQRLIQRHPSLRIMVNPSISPPGHVIAALAPAPGWCVFDPEKDERDKVVTAAHVSLDPSQAKNVSAVFFPEERRLLLVIHHLAVDILSWSTLLSDLEHLYARSEEPPPLHGTSFASWARRLEALSQQGDGLPTVDFWMVRLAGSVSPLLPQIGRHPGLESEVERLSMRLGRSETLQLTSAGPSAFGLSVDELLILAVIVEAKSRNVSSLRIDLERNGRGLDLDSIDISQTVGWFTSIIPLRIPTAGSAQEQARLIRTLVDEQPLAGLGFGLARELGPAAPILATLPEADLLINYVGAPRAWDRGPWQPADEPSGPAIAPGVHRTHMLELNAGVISGELRLEVNFPGRPGARDVVLQWLDSLTRTIVTLAHEAQQSRFQGKLPENCVQVLPATPAQTAIYWHSHRLTSTYHDQLLLSLSGPVDSDQLREAFLEVVAAHEALRCVFQPDVAERIHQVILEELTPEWRVLDFLGNLQAEIDADILDLAAADRAESFDLAKGPLQRVHLIRVGDGDYRLLWSCHHLVTDGWSVSVIIEELLERYAARMERRPPLLMPAASLSDVLRSRAVPPGSSEWLEGLLVGGDFPRLEDATVACDDTTLPRHLTVQLKKPLLTSIKLLTQRLGTSLAVGFQAAWGLVLGRLLDSDTAVFGLSMAGRPLDVAGAERTVGMFVNTLPVKADVAAHTTVSELIESLHNQAIHRERFCHTDLAGVLRLHGSGSSAPFDTLLLVQSYPMPKTLKKAGIELRLLSADESTEFVATLAVELGDSPSLMLLRDPVRLSHAAADVMLQKFVDALHWFVTSPDQRISEFDKPSPPPQQVALPLPPITFPLQVERWSALAPRGLAIIDSRRKVTYEELQAESLRLASKLMRSGVRRGNRVLLALEPSADFVVALLATMRTGATVSALDLSYPEAARCYQVRDYDPHAIICLEADAMRSIAPEAHVIVLPVSEYDEGPAKLPVPEADDAAYLIYTSGSTGMPKGSFCSHRGLATLAESQRVLFALKPGDRVLQAASLAFDASIWEIALALASGATLHIPARGTTKAGEELANYIAQQQISVATLPPSVLATFPALALPSLHTIVVAGEPCPPNLAKRWSKGRRFFNAYGPSEASICATVHEGAGDEQEVPIGRVIPGVEAYVTDRLLRPMPDGFAGELVIGGAGVGLGYWKRPELTEEKFPEDTLGQSAGRKLYRSGDRARRDNNGLFHFLGRIDRQIKLRGFRIEPGQIEAFLMQIDGVERAVASARTLPQGESALLVWLVARPTVDLALVREKMRTELPQQLVPHHLLRIESLPLKLNGKIDWDALPLPGDQQPVTATASETIAASYLSKVASLWRRVLPNVASGPDDSFFDAGGDSLLLVKLLSLISAETGIRIGAGQVIANPTQRAIAARLEQTRPIPDTPVAEQAGSLPDQPHLAVHTDSQETIGVVTQLWRQILPAGKSEPDDDFFDAGGDSLLLVKLLSLIAQRVGVRLRTGQVIGTPTPRSIAALLDDARPAARQPSAPAAPVAQSKATAPDTSHGTGSAGPAMPVAIIGMSGRFPGAPNLDAFRELLREGREGLSRLTPEEMTDAGASDYDIKQDSWVPVAGLIDNAEAFDHEVFGISRKEATLLDPQHRVFLECAWHALEDAGYPGRSGARDCGVFAGCGMNRWLHEVLLPNGASFEGSAGFHLATANEKDFLAPQTAFRLNLTGPALTIQTFCSTSLVALARAVAALRANECGMALAGGVSIAFPQGRGYRYEPDMILSPDGHCRTFSEDSAGTVPSAGVGVVVLKLLDKAIADGDAIHAVIRGVGTNNDGSAKVAFSAPGVEGQAAAIAKALADAGLGRDDVDYVEAHGTGTQLGDPVEILALSRVFSGRAEPLLLGSVKSMIGHCDAAAGVAGLMKTVLALQEENLPVSLHAERLNPKIPFGSGPFEVVSRPRPWPKRNRPRRAGVSSFGIGGTNAHIVLEAAPVIPIKSEPDRPHMPILLVGQTEESLQRQREWVSSIIGSAARLERQRIAATLMTRASRLPLRRAFVAGAGQNSLRPVSAMPRKVVAQPKLAFLMPGQGSQAPGMAEHLYHHEPVFRDHLEGMSRQLESILGKSIAGLLYGEEPLPDEEISNTALAQPLILSVSVACGRMWQARGVIPDAFLGHSVGEIAAAHMAGVMDEDTALSFIAVRGRIAAQQPHGAMLAVAMSEAVCRQLLTDDICLAAVNGSSQCVLSGPSDKIERLERDIIQSGASCQRLKISHAFHSSMMAAAARELAVVFRGVPLSAPKIPIVSSVTGTWLTESEATDPDFWCGQLMRTVQFSAAVTTLLQAGIRLGLDVGPGRVVADLAEAVGMDTVACMGRAPVSSAGGSGEYAHAVASLWERGIPIEPDPAFRGPPVRLPGYPFARTVCAPERKDRRELGPASVRYYSPVLEPVREPAGFMSPGTTILQCDDPVGRKKALEILRNLGADIIEHTPEEESVPVVDVLAHQCAAWTRVFQRSRRGPDTVIVITMGDRPSHSPVRSAMAPTLNLLGLTQGLERQYPGRPCRIIYITIADGSTPPSFAASLAAGQIVAVEHEQLDIRLVETDSAMSLPSALRHGLSTEAAAGQLSLCRGRAFRGGVQAVELPPADSWPGIRPGSLLVTGGFGHLGSVLANEFAKNNDLDVVLLGRTERPEVAETLRQRGISVSCHAIDAANISIMQELVKSLAASGRPVRGVIHAAGIADWGGIILRRTEADIERVWAGKVGGLLALEAALAGTDLDALLLCSTLGSFLPTAKFGQVGYASANAYLDAAAGGLARRYGWPVRVVNWDDFIEGGITVEASRLRGIEPPDASSGLTDQQISTAASRIMSSPYRRLAATVHELPFLMRRFQEHGPADQNSGQPVTEVENVTATHEEAPAETGLLGTIVGAFRSVLGGEDVSAHTDFFAAGGHSLLAIQVIGKIRAHAGVEVGLADLFEAPTSDLLAKRLTHRNTGETR